MRTGTGSERAESLLVELAARTAIIDGHRIEVPPTEFALLAVLAARPGEVVSHKELAAEAFGEGAAMAPHDLHWRIWKLRELVGDKQREDKLIENRRGQGYVLNLPKAAVDVLQGVAALSKEDAVEAIREEVSSPISEPDQIRDLDSPAQVPEEIDRIETRGLRPRVVIAASIAALLALSASWFTGFALSSRNAPPSQSHPQPGQNETVSERQPRKVEPSNEKPRRKEPRNKNARGERSSKGKTGSNHHGETGPLAAPPVIAAPDPGSQPAPSGDQSDTSRGSASSAKPSEPKPALPAAPTRYLYHLEHPETGDHFVTTDGNLVSTYEGRGYVGGAIGRVYTSAPQGVATRAISTNRGTAYIFSNSSAKTEPASSMLPLYYSTNNNGDFFYTTSANEAKATGWDGVLIGYVRTLG